MSEEKRLKRGLGDVSQLFAPQVPAQSAAVRETAGSAEEWPLASFQCFGAASPDPAHHSLLLQALAAQLAAARRSLTVLSLPSAVERISTGRFNPAPVSVPEIRHYPVSWDEMQSFLKASTPAAASFVRRAGMLLLDFDAANPCYFEKLIPVLDRYVLLAAPQLESISETYRLVKSAHALNPHLEFGLIINAGPEDLRAAMLFEQLARMMAGRLGISLNWLGTLDAAKGQGTAQFSVSSMLATAVNRLDSVEKLALAFSCRELTAHA